VHEKTTNISRAQYDPRELGSKIFSVKGVKYKRTDFELVNKRGQKLVCSQYYGLKHRKQMPVVINCHGNAGCRLDASEATRVLLPMGISVVCFDFSGSGNSEGEYVSLGFYEQDDLATVVEYLRSNNTTTRIGLWGRSMGAATALMFGVSDPSVACMVLDSPFSSLETLANELVGKAEMKIPKLVVGAAFKMIKKSVEKKANFDINKLKPIKSAPQCFIPALFAHANGDDFIAPSHSKAICDCYVGDKNLINFEGDHQSRRPGFFYDSTSIFFSNYLLIESDFKDDNPFVEEKDTSPEQLISDGGDDDLELALQLSLAESQSQKSAQDEIKAEVEQGGKSGGGGGGGNQNTVGNGIPNDEEEQLKLALALSLMDVKSNEQEEAPKEEPKSQEDNVAKQPDKKSKESKDAKKGKKDKKDENDTDYVELNEAEEGDESNTKGGDDKKADKSPQKSKAPKKKK